MTAICPKPASCILNCALHSRNSTHHGIVSGRGVIVRWKCVKASEKKKQRDLLLTKLVLKTDEIERGMNFDGDGESAKG